ncbi:MAG: PhzF family phenazine biosynthesis protein [Jaaginema sp. PMC 1079.18]|nr:PhzF family phenazine biosynthesis protein [Jaaginema sp. PMC 1080.18]MEC4850262.1 PhzF family phenazine biosynthesis protein [Jaaginema sp. PMC 1079.18]MEC4866912.1 PhzF family phenazine biosynthesis protein [Jaaginema sp. PMC 1078.18]
MTQIPFYIVDVFARDRYTGNPLAVVLDADDLSDREMQQIAQEMNYSETTYVSRKIAQNRGYNVRIFTPETELPFAGHPTLGTAYIIKHFVVQESQTSQVLLNLKGGEIPVTFKPKDGDREEIWMQQNPPQFTEIFDPDEMAAVLSLDAEEIDSRFPVQAVSTGVCFAIVPLRSLAAVKKARLHRDRYFPWQNNTAARGILLFCPETYAAENDLNVRVFAEAVGVPEDPATGSANGCLAAYLVQHQYWGCPSLKARVEQGYEIKRPSLLLLQASLNHSTWEILVGGAVILVARGELICT